MIPNIFSIFRCFHPKYWKIYHSQIINDEDVASIKLGCNNKYYIEVYIHKLDTIMYIGKDFNTIEEAVQRIKDTENGK